MTQELIQQDLQKSIELLKATQELLIHCSVEDGVCCCGDDMNNHPSPMSCGHSSVDHGQYIADQILKEIEGSLERLKNERN